SYGDWSSDVCSSDLIARGVAAEVADEVIGSLSASREPIGVGREIKRAARRQRDVVAPVAAQVAIGEQDVARAVAVEITDVIGRQIGRASCRESGNIR